MRSLASQGRRPLIKKKGPKDGATSSPLRTRLLAAAMFLAILFMLCTAYGYAFGNPLPYSRTPATPLIITLPGYGTISGTQIIRHLRFNKALDTPVDAWLGLDYAKQPVGDLRFAPPQWPKAFNGTKDASQYGPSCIQSPNGQKQSEACLNFNVYRTSGVPFSRKLPVMVFFHGGSFVGGNGRSFDGATFVSGSMQPLMVVTMQYRLAALGSLPSKLFEEEGLLNLDLLDQRLLLQFLQKHIGYFGGDAEKITLAGQSAGGHSVGVHLFHNYGEDRGKPLFSQAIMSSGSPTARAFPNATYPLYQRQFKEFMDYVGCPLSPNKKALSCLRSADISKIQAKQSAMYSASTYNITWPFQPVSPGPLLEKRGSKSGEDGTFFPIPILLSSTTDEGKLFAPKNLTTTSHFVKFMKNMNPGLTRKDLVNLTRLYPNPDDEDSPFADSPITKQYNRVAAAYGDYAYICPVQETAYRFSKAGVPVYKARFDTPNNSPSWQGVPHASDAMYFNGASNVQFPDISELYSSYWASFVVSGNPNTYAILGAPSWNIYGGLGQSELAVGSLNGTGTRDEYEGDGIRMAACAWWRDEHRMKRLGK